MRYLNRHNASVLGVFLLALGLSGCASELYRQAIPASCAGPSFPTAPRSNKKAIDYGLLTQPPPAVYLVGPKDVLGIYIDGILGKRDEAPPVHTAEEGLAPSIGYPIPVREDGTISVPLVPPIPVAGLTLPQVEEQLRVAYLVQRQILQPGAHRIMATLMKPRTYSVLVIREDTSMIGELPESSEATQGRLGATTLGATKFGATHLVELRAYENDVLHALSKGGGLPGLDAVSELTVIRGGFQSPEDRQRILSSPTAWNATLENNPNVIRIPLCFGSA